MERGRELDKKVAVEVMKWKKEDLLKPTRFGAEYAFPHYSSNMIDAMTVAEKINLFDGYVLHRVLGAYTVEWDWHVSKIDDRGVVQGFVCADNPETAICLAALKVMEKEVDN